MSDYTPGPWIWRGKSGSLHQVGTPPYQFGKRVLEPTYEYDEGADTKVSEADAKLIAAAPALYEACASAWLMLAATGDNELRLIADECRAALELAGPALSNGDRK